MIDIRIATNKAGAQERSANIQGGPEVEMELIAAMGMALDVLAELQDMSIAEQWSAIDEIVLLAAEEARIKRTSKSAADEAQAIMKLLEQARSKMHELLDELIAEDICKDAENAGPADCDSNKNAADAADAGIKVMHDEPTDD